jgi:hypothetical protein
MLMAKYLPKRMGGLTLIQQPRGRRMPELVRRYIDTGFFPVLS